MRLGDLEDIGDDTPLLMQILLAGLWNYLQDCEVSADSRSVDGIARPLLCDVLARDDRFLSGPLSALHPEIGSPRCDYRSLQGKFGPGSLQVVVNPETLRCHLDIDRYNPYHDLVRWIGHTGEVAGNWFRRMVRRRGGDRA